MSLNKLYIFLLIDNIKNFIKNFKEITNNTIKLDFNFDGLITTIL
jgi:hypothetical protein